MALSVSILNRGRSLLLNEKAELEVQLSRGGYRPSVSIKDSHAKELTFRMWKKEDGRDAVYWPRTYSIVFTPTTVGSYDVEIAAINVNTMETEAKRNVSFQVVNTRLLNRRMAGNVGNNVSFTVIAASPAPVEATIVNPDGIINEMTIRDGSVAGEHLFDYRVSTIGLHSIDVYHAGIQLPGSPYEFRGYGYKMWGRGIAPEGIRKNDVVGVHVRSLDPEENIANSGLSLKILRKNGRHLPMSVHYDKVSSTLNYVYQPEEAPECIEVVLMAGVDLVETHVVHVSNEEGDEATSGTTINTETMNQFLKSFAIKHKDAGIQHAVSTLRDNLTNNPEHISELVLIQEHIVKLEKDRAVSELKTHIDLVIDSAPSIKRIILVSTNDGVVMAHSEKLDVIKATYNELESLIHLFNDVTSLQGKGVSLEGAQYVVSRNENNLILAKKEKTGFFAAKTKSAVLIAVYEGPEEVTAQVLNVAKDVQTYLANAGY